MKILNKKAFLAFVLSTFCAGSLFANDTVIIDTINGKINVPKNPKKIMIFDFAVLDTINALGIKNLKLGLPLKSLPDVHKNNEKDAINLGGIKEPNIEKVYTFKPDVIFINGRTAPAYKTLSKIAPTVQIQLDYNNYIESAKKLSMKLAKIFNKEKVIKKSFLQIDEKVKEITQISKNSKKEALIILTNNGKLSAYGAGSRFGFIYTDLGLLSVDKNITSSKHGQRINYEYVSKMNPDILLYIDRTLISGGTTFASKTLNNDLVKQTKAGKNAKIIALDSDNWYLMPGGLNAVNTQLDEVLRALK